MRQNGSDGLDPARLPISKLLLVDDEEFVALIDLGFSGRFTDE